MANNNNRNDVIIFLFCCFCYVYTNIRNFLCVVWLQKVVTNGDESIFSNNYETPFNWNSNKHKTRIVTTPATFNSNISWSSWILLDNVLTLQELLISI